MSDCIARIDWSGHDLESVTTESGVLLARASDVVISRREVTRGEELTNERLGAFSPDEPPTDEEIQAIMQEVQSDPTANEVVQVWYRKSIQLSETYHLTYAEHPGAGPLTGFGLSGGIGPIVQDGEGCPVAFSWEWFNVESPGKAVKLQETGSVDYAQSDTPAGREITRMYFETDVSIRMVELGSFDIFNPKWRLKIREGSGIFWPSLVDGEIVPNGFIP